MRSIQEALMIRSFVLCACIIAASATEQVPIPTPVPDQKAFAVIVVPNPAEALAHCEQIANLFAPTPLKPGDLAAMLGLPLGDPGLTKLGQGPVLIVLGPGGMAPTLAVIFPSTDTQRHAGSLRQATLQAEVAGNLVIAGRKAADLDLGL
jgi:hypothetical protein